MLMPSIFGENLFDSWMDFPFGRSFEKEFAGTKNLMKTDIKENDSGYEVAIDLPGFKKEDIQLSLQNGYLSIGAERNMNREEKDENGRYIRRERFSGSMRRSFYVGDSVTEADVKARLEDGILKLALPKKEAKAVGQESYIAIEG